MAPWQLLLTLTNSTKLDTHTLLNYTISAFQVLTQTPKLGEKIKIETACSKNTSLGSAIVLFFLREQNEGRKHWTLQLNPSVFPNEKFLDIDFTFF